MHTQPFHMLYSGSVSGTKISRNSIVDSNHRCIVIDGTSDVLIEENVAYDTAGHCFVVGFESSNNSLIRNLGSFAGNSKIQWNTPLVPGEIDQERATFFAWYPGNDYIGNVAAGSQMDGFRFYMFWYTRGEVGEHYLISNISTGQHSIPIFDKSTSKQKVNPAHFV